MKKSSSNSTINRVDSKSNLSRKYASTPSSNSISTTSSSGSSKSYNSNNNANSNTNGNKSWMWRLFNKQQNQQKAAQDRIRGGSSSKYNSTADIVTSKNTYSNSMSPPVSTKSASTSATTMCTYTDDSSSAKKVVRTDISPTIITSFDCNDDRNTTTPVSSSSASRRSSRKSQEQQQQQVSPMSTSSTAVTASQQSESINKLHNYQYIIQENTRRKSIAVEEQYKSSIENTKFRNSIGFLSSSPSLCSREYVDSENVFGHLYVDNDIKMSRRQSLIQQVDDDYHASIDNSKFKHSVGFLRNSISMTMCKSPCHQYTDEDNFGTKLYQYDTHWKTTISNRNKLMHKELEDMRKELEDKELTFKPALLTKKHVHHHNSSGEDTYTSNYKYYDIYKAKHDAYKVNFEEEYMHQHCTNSPRTNKKSEALAAKRRKDMMSAIPIVDEPVATDTHTHTPTKHRQMDAATHSIDDDCAAVCDALLSVVDEVVRVNDGTVPVTHIHADECGATATAAGTSTPAATATHTATPTATASPFKYDYSADINVFDHLYRCRLYYNNQKEIQTERHYAQYSFSPKVNKSSSSSSSASISNISASSSQTDSTASSTYRKSVASPVVKSIHDNVKLDSKQVDELVHRLNREAVDKFNRLKENINSNVSVLLAMHTHAFSLISHNNKTQQLVENKRRKVLHEIFSLLTQSVKYNVHVQAHINPFDYEIANAGTGTTTTTTGTDDDANAVKYLDTTLAMPSMLQPLELSIGISVVFTRLQSHTITFDTFTDAMIDYLTNDSSANSKALSKIIDQSNSHCKRKSDAETLSHTDREVRECKQTPTVTNNRTMRVYRSRRSKESVKIEERLMNDYNRRNSMLDRLRQEQQMEQLKECSFKPHIHSSYSKPIKRK